MRFVLIMFCLVLMLISCKSTKDVTTQQSSEETIVFGNGGGFSGRVTHYTLNSKGDFFKGINKEAKLYTYPKLEKGLVEQIFDNYDNLKLSEIEFNETGNLYKFLNVKKDGREHKLMWGDGNSNPPEKLLIYYNNLMAIARRANNGSSSNANPVR